MRRAGLRTLVFMVAAAAVAQVSASDAPSPLGPGKFGQAVLLKGGRKMLLPLGAAMKSFPITYELWFRLDSTAGYNILLSAAPKQGAHWELFASPGEGRLFLYIPQISGTENIGGSEPVADGKWHFAAVRFRERTLELYVDGRLVLKKETTSRFTFDESPLYIGGIANEVLVCDGAVDELHISRRTDDLAEMVPNAPVQATPTTLHLFHFDNVADGTVRDEAPGAKTAGQIVDRYTRPIGGRFLDEVQDEAFAASSLYGDQGVEDESRLPVYPVPAEAAAPPLQTVEPTVLSLSGEWLMKDCDPRIDKQGVLQTTFESPGVKAGWFRPTFDRSDWYKVQVPTSVQTALIRLGKLQDPNWGSNTYDELDRHGLPKDVGWMNRHTRVEQKDWWFARKFELPADWKGRAVRLHFDGIDYGGSVYLNGKSLGYHAGMFGGPTRNVSRLLNYGGDNWLVVRVDKAPDHWNGRLKGSPGWGWHYGHLISVGIWRDVTLRVVPDVEVNNPYVVTKTIGNGSADLEVEYCIDNYGAEPAKVTVTTVVEGANFKSPRVSFANKVQAPHGRTRWRTKVTITDAKPWWPMNYGEQSLYKLELTAAVGDRPVDTKTARFGIRTIEMRPATGAMPESDYRWQFVINGRPMFIKGANWCWSDPMLECNPAKYEKILELARRGGIQMFRAWGGGIIETDTFYDKCDEKGLMVYQEFPFCWGPPDFPGTNAAMVDQQVTTVVKRNRNHPSLIMWGGGNENVVAEGNDEGLFLTGRRCRQYDPSRPFHRTDPWGGSAHNWSVFHNGQPMDANYHSFSSVFYGEYGLPSMTNLSSCLKYLPPEELDKWPMDDTRHAMIQHMNQFSSRDPIKVLKYCDYGPIKDWRTYIEYSQMAQGDWLRLAAEGQRSCSGADKTGFWFYKFTDLFPGHSWAVVDYYGSPKLSYYRAKQTCRPRCAFAVAPKLEWADGEKFTAVIHAANDTAQVFAGAKVKASVFGSDLTEVWTRDYDAPKLGPDERAELGAVAVAVPAGKCKPFLMAVTMRDADGKLLSDQWYWFNFKAKTEKVKELDRLDSWQFPENRFKEAYEAYATIPQAPLLSLPKAELAVDMSKQGRKGTLTIRNKGSVPAFNVLIDNFPDGYEDYLDDNSIFLRPGEKRVVAFELGEKSILADVAVRAWNAPSIRIR